MTMNRDASRFFTALAVLMMAGQLMAEGKPLKVYILAGQSNMQGQAQVKTIERLKLDGGSKELYRDMMGDDDVLDAPKGVYGVFFSDGDMSKGAARPLVVSSGPLLPGLSPTPGPKTRFGPDYTFGIYMRKHLNEPILIIKTAWGGRNLLQQFRSPSAGDYTEAKDKHGNPTGAYYQLMMKNVQSVLADPGKYHPEYDPNAGYEIAGFVWFQGYNDFIGAYPEGDYSEYTRLLSCLVRDVRKDLKVAKLPVVIGVMGIDGPDNQVSPKQLSFRKSQCAVAAMPEFKGNVVAVETGELWDMEFCRIRAKLKAAIEEKVRAESPRITERSLNKLVKTEWNTTAPLVLTPDERNILEIGSSNQSYHYMGSAQIYGNIGKAFADAMARMSTDP